MKATTLDRRTPPRGAAVGEVLREENAGMIRHLAIPRALLLCIMFVTPPGLSVAQEAAPVTCKDGTTSPHGGRGACSRHGGIDQAATAAEAQGTDNTPPPGTGSNPIAGNREPMQGGGPGRVWVNTASKVYYCPSDPRYGKTGKGQYMTEGEAQAKGIRAAHNKPCG
jgi:hypothetical protein